MAKQDTKDLRMVESVEVKDVYLAPHCRLGEGPLYDPESDILLWVDIIGKKVHWVDYSKSDDVEYTRKSHRWVSVNNYIGCIGLTDQKLKYIAAAELGFGVVDLSKAEGKGEEVEIEYKDVVHKPEDMMRFNDGVIDPAGRFFAGSMWEWRGSPHSNGKLYCLDAEGFVSVAHEGIGTPNGMAFSQDAKTFFLTDSDKQTIFKFDYDIKTGALSNQREFLKVEKEVNPDGFHMDTAGNFWIAIWNGDAVRKYSPTGELLLEYKFPAKRISCTAFAGKNMDELIVTSASLHLRDPDYVYPEAGEADKGGDIFRIKLSGVTGTNRNVYKLN